MKILSLLFLLVLSNCLSLASFTGDRTKQYDFEKKACVDSSSYGLVYGGIRGDFDFMISSWKGSHHPHAMVPDWLIFTFAFIDSPMSFALDTVFLPITIVRSTLEWNSFRLVNNKLEQISEAERTQIIQSNQSICDIR